MGPLQDLLRCLQEAVHTTYSSETISIPRNIINSVLQLSPLQVFPDIDRLVELFDGLYEGNCSRLDVSSFQCILYVLLGGYWGLSQERGLCLFLNSIRNLTDGSSEADQSTAVSISHQSKSAIGQKTLQLCLTHFTDTSGPEVPRRWSGRLLLELLRGSADNRELLASGPEETRRGLGKLVLHSSDYALRFIAADIIREMMSAQLGPEIFWPLGSNPKLATTFPSGRLSDSDWIKDFCSFIHEVDEEISGDKIEKGQCMHITLSITTGDSSYLPRGLSLALVMSNCVILVHATTKDTAFQFIDIMLDKIERCSVGEEDRSAINLELVKRGIGNYLKDGLTEKAGKFSMVFGNGEQANKFLAAIERAAPHLAGAQFPQDTGKKGRRISAAYVALAGPSSPTSISPSMLPILHNSTPRGKENTKTPRVASFTILSLPSQEEVVARSSAFLDAQLSPRNDTVPTCGSDDSTAIDDCPELIKSSSRSRTQNDPRELENVEIEDDQVFPTSDKPVLSETEKHPTAGCSRDTQLEETNVDNEVQVASLRVVNSDGSMRLQQSEGPDPYSGLPSPIRQTPHPSSQDNVPFQNSTSPGHDPSLRSRSPQFGNGDMDCITKPGADSVEIPDSQQDGINSNDAQLENGMASVDSISPTEIQEPSNADDTSIIPAESVSISRLKRPRQKIIGSGVKRETMDWDQDLRVSNDDEKNVPSNKKPKTSLRKAPMRTKAKNSPATKPNRQAKAMPKTPKVETPATIKEPKMARKRPPTKTFTSSRQRRAAAAKANETIANTKYGDSDNFDVDDPIETTSPEPSSLEMPVTKPAMSKKFPRAEKIEAPNLLAPESVRSGDEHGPIILNSPIDDEAAAVHQSLDKSPTSPTANEALVLDTSVSDLDATLLCCVDSQPSLQGVDTPPCISDILATAKDLSPRQSPSSGLPDDIIPACIPERTNTEGIEATGSRKQTFAEKLSLALLGTGVYSADNVKYGGDEIMHIEESPPIPEIDLANAMILPQKEKPSQVSQKVAEFMSRKPRAGKSPPDINDDGLMANLSTQGLGNCNLNGNDNSVKDLHAPNYQALTKAHRFSETTSMGKAPNLSCPVPPPEAANLSNITTENDQPNQAPKSPLVDERTHRKAQIVSFDIDGPRNQCLSSTKKPSVRHSKPITPILKEPRKSTILKRKASTQREERSSPNQIAEDVLPTPNAKRQMTEPTTEKSDTFPHEDTGSGHDLLRSELLSQNRPSQLLGSQQSMVDLNGSPRRVTRVPRNPRMTRVQDKEVMKDERKQECAAEPNLIGPRDHNITGKGDVQIQSFEERGSDEENIDPASSDFVPEQDISPKGKEECKPLGSNGARFLFRGSQLSTKTPLQEPQSKHAIIPPKSDIKPSRFIDSLASHPRTTGGRLDVDSEAETELELADDDTDGVSSCSTDDSISSHSSETLVPPGLHADVEWRDTLRATQKTTLDILLDTSKRLVRHLVDEETAITDLVTIYQNGCAKLLEQLQKAHDENIEERERQTQPLEKSLRAVYEGTNGRLKTSREKIQKLPTTKELFSGVRKRKGLVSRLEDVMNGYGVETDC